MTQFEVLSLWSFRYLITKIEKYVILKISNGIDTLYNVYSLSL